MIVVEVILLILFALLIIVILFMGFGIVKLRVDARVINMQVELRVGVGFCGIRLLTLELPDSDAVHESSMIRWITHVMEQNKKVEEMEKRAIRQVIEGVKMLLHHKILSKELEQLTIKSLRLSHIYWDTTVGLGEADKTAVSVGLLWALKSNLISSINSGVLQGKMTGSVLHVHPDYSERLGFRTHFKCMIRFRLGHAISKAFKIARDKKRGRKTCQKNIQYKA